MQHREPDASSAFNAATLSATTGLRLDYDADGSSLDLVSLLPYPRRLASLSIESGCFRLESSSDPLDRHWLTPEARISLGAESRLVVTAKEALRFVVERDQRWNHQLERPVFSTGKRKIATVRANEEGGFVLFSERRLEDEALNLRAGETMEFQSYSPRPRNIALVRTRIAHEGRSRKPLPDDVLIESLAEHADVLALHAYFWKEEDKSRRPLFSRYRFRPNPWRNSRHDAEDPEALRRVMAKARSFGMKVLPYLSPRYSAAPDMLAEMARLQELWNFDGFYLDGLRGDVEEQVQFMRRLRALLGEDSLIYLNASSGPFEDPAIPTPAIDSWADFVLRGDSGRGGLSRETFLREALSAWNRSNAQAFWCHYGSSCGPLPFDRVPGSEDTEAALKAHVRLWRRSFWTRGSRSLADFDRHYEAELAALVATEEMDTNAPAQI